LASNPTVHFTGWVPHEDLPAYYNLADVLLHPSNSEGLPNVILEALAHGLPVVATDSGGEVPVHVSNIGRNVRDLGEMVLAIDTLEQDSLHPDVRPDRNRTLYLRLFETCTSGLSEGSDDSRGE
jgi:glycosyltransferase involved in cell wall biosynthesis